MKPMVDGKHIVGTALPSCTAPRGPSPCCITAAGLLRPGDVLVIDRLGDTKHACFGGGVCVAVKTSGAVAVILDGPCTDPSEIRREDFPLWCRGVSPITTRVYDIGGSMNVAVSCRWCRGEPRRHHRRRRERRAGASRDRRGSRGRGGLDAPGAERTQPGQGQERRDNWESFRRDRQGAVASGPRVRR